MNDLEAIEQHVRQSEILDPNTDLVIRGSPLTVDGLLHNADATRRRYSLGARPFVAVSADVTIGAWDLGTILSGRRLRTRPNYAATAVGQLAEAGFELLATFGAPHYSVILPSYTRETAERLLEVLGAPIANPHYVRREQ